MATRLPASKARSTLVARLVRAAADWAREHNGAEIVGRVKRAPLVQKVLYQPLKEKPQMLDEDVTYIRSTLDRRDGQRREAVRCRAPVTLGLGRCLT